MAAEAHSANMSRRHDDLAEKCLLEREAKQAALNAMGAAEARMRKAVEKARGAERDRDLIMLTLKDKEKVLLKIEREAEHNSAVADAEEAARRRHDVLRGRESRAAETGDGDGYSGAAGAGVGAESGSLSASPNRDFSSPTRNMQFQRPTYESSGKSSYLRRSSEGVGTGTGGSTKRSGGGAEFPSRSIIGTSGNLTSDMASEARHTRTSRSATTATTTTGAGAGAGGGLIARVAAGAPSGAAARSGSRSSVRLAGEAASPMTPSARRSQAAMAKHRERMAKQRASSKKNSDYW